jgi:hypothetical protein
MPLPATADSTSAIRRRPSANGSAELHSEVGPVVDETQIDRQLCGEGIRRQLGQRESFLIGGFGNPVASLDKVATHVADERQRVRQTRACPTSRNILPGSKRHFLLQDHPDLP